jgi:CheY-like chemotaxis protein
MVVADLESWPGAGDARVDPQIVAFDTHAEDRFQPGAVEPTGGARVPRPSAASDTLGAQDFDVAVVDVNLAGVSVYPVADELMRRGINLVIVTGYGEEGVLPHYRTSPVISKPYTREDILQALLHLHRPVVQPSEP